MALLILCVAAGVLGSVALRPMRLGTDVESLSYRLVIGLVLGAVIVIAFGSWSLRTAQAAVVLTGCGGLAFELFGHSRRQPAGPPPHAHAAEPLTPLEWCCACTVAMALLFSLLSALAPVTSWDAGVAHLAVPAAYLREGRIRVMEGYAYSGFPQLLHALYTFTMAHGGERSAVLLNWLMSGMACSMVFALARRLAGRRAGWIAAAMLASAPIFIDQAGTASIDLAFTAMTLAALNALVAWRQDRRVAWLLVAGFVAGSACGIRHTGYLVCVLLAVGVLCAGGKRRAPATALFVLMLLAGALPWLLRSALVLGNPVYPFLMAQLSPDVLPDIDITAASRHESIKSTSVTTFLTFPWFIVMRPDRFDGWTQSPGPWVLFLGIPGIFVGDKRTRYIALYAVLGGACLFFLRHYARYYLPFFVPMMAVAAVAACRLKPLQRGIAVLLVISFGFGLVVQMGAIHFKLPAVLAFETREEYLTRRVERYPAFAWVSDSLSASDTVLTLDPRSYYIRGRSYANFEALKGLVGTSYGEQLAWLRAREIRYLLYPLDYVADSPGYNETGVRQVVSKWRHHPEHFHLLHRMDLANPRGDGVEGVEIYQVQAGD